MCGFHLLKLLSPFFCVQVWQGVEGEKTCDSQEGRICHYSEYGQRSANPCHCPDNHMFWYI